MVGPRSETKGEADFTIWPGRGRTGAVGPVLTREDVGGKTVLIGLRGLRKAECEPRWTRHLREKYDMAVALKLSDELIEMAKPYAAAMHHSIAEQIEHWAWLGKSR
jgi:hypothetical protein